MNTYVETNFVLELAFLQEQQESCEELLKLCEAGSARLILPAFSIAESYESLIRRANNRKRIANELAVELNQLSRSKPYKTEIEALPSAVDLLARSSQDEDQRLIAVLARLLAVAEIVPLEAAIVAAATTLRSDYELSPQDSIVYASVRRHLMMAAGAESCFISRNSRDFNDPDIEEDLARLGCKMLFSYENGYNYTRSRLSP